ncbi:MAG: InlB B-repeat-containing protein [Clostridia bacterium]|nr:InlB B-repeat-containing protein [Clostridia bacterium]
MKKILKVILLAAVLTLALACAACGLTGFISSREGTVTGTDYKVTVSLDGGKGVTAKDFVSGSKLVEPVAQPTKDRYVFDGWYADAERNEKIKFNVTITSDVKIYAKWTPKASEATFVFGAGIESVTVVAEENKYSPPTTPERLGYTLVGWYTDNTLREEADFDQVAVDGATFYADWSAIEYKVTYDFDGLGTAGAGTVTTYTVEDSFRLVEPTVVESGYEFLHWTDEEGEEQYSVAKGTVGDKAYKAIYLSHNNTVDALDRVGGLISSDAVTIGVRYTTTAINPYEILSVDERATVEIYDGETLLANEKVALNVGTKNYTLKITAEAGEKKEYTLSVTRYDEGSAIVRFYFPDETFEEKAVEIGGTVSAPEAKSILAYAFAGWYKESAYKNYYHFEDAVVEDIDLYAKYIPVVYSVSYHFGIGSAPATYAQSYTYETGVTLAAPSAPSGYEFAGYVDEDGLDISAIPVGYYGDVEVYAKYNRIGVDFLTASYTADNQPLTKEELTDYINWAVAYRYTTVTFELTDETTHTELSEVLNLKGVTVLNSSVSMHSDSYSYNPTTGVVTTPVTVHFTYVEPAKAAAEEDAYTQLGYYAHDAYTSKRANDFDDFKIESIATGVSVENSDQLVYATMSGYRPVPVADSPAEAMYAAAKAVLRQIVDDDMTDIEKAHAIYDWLIDYVVYDHDLAYVVPATIAEERNALVTEYNNMSEGTEKEEKRKEIDAKDREIKTYKGFYLEGVFVDRRAVCDGISKAYALLCNIEGIECVQVTGYAWKTDENREFVLDAQGNKVQGTGHAWNKIKINGFWFVVDPTHGGTVISSMEVLNHGYFFITDAERDVTARATDHTDLVADMTYEAYENITFTFDEKEYDMVVESRAELRVVLEYLSYLKKTYGNGQTLDVRMDYAYEDIGSELSAAAAGTGLSYSYSGGAKRGDVLILIVVE